MLRMELGRTYRFTLQAQKTVDIIVHGSKQGAHGVAELEISVNGTKNTYPDLNGALGDAFVKVERI